MAAKKLLIVESPAKAGTIKKYLGSDYNVMATVGHIIDLPKSQLGVDVDDGFEPKYITIRGKGDLLTKLKREAKAASKVYLATDPDREGEAISWHLANALSIDPNSKCRVTFNEVTKTAVKEAIKNPRAIDMDLVNAQQARRVLDRVVGYKLSPILWEKVKKGLSAGRVQSVATRLICDREEEIQNFIPKEYWTVEANLTDAKSKKSFTAKYYGTGSKETELSDGDTAKKVINEVQKEKFIVSKIKHGESVKNPPAPFTTSTMQQDASRKISFSPYKTMQTAQALYEGINLGSALGGTVGLITYMRTDSLRISADAKAEVAGFITENYGKENLRVREYKTKNNAQDAHEAIRPTSVKLTPQLVKDKLTNDQFKLYKLIWERFVASQMMPAVFDTTAVSICAGKHEFRANGMQLKSKGFTAIYQEGSDTAEEKAKKLPVLQENTEVKLNDIDANQHFTQPPARFSEATLVRELEEKGIGRPSTYAPTITTITARGYVARNKKQLIPTELGMVTTDLLKSNFEDIVDVQFTAGMEEQLDDVAEGKIAWKDVLENFYPNFAKNLENAKAAVEKIKIKDEESDVICDKCGRKMVYKIGKFGKFLACPGYPECKNTMTIKKGTGAVCPKCGKEIVEKNSKRGRVFYGCEGFPKCDFMSWDKPIADEKCPECGGLLLAKQGRGAKVYCQNEACKYERKGKK
ncbi:MAG: type I DNA topoisomerase [Clostridia bacterium]|nr:type I DNA topoisomerase [Clostridia bacterium]